MNCVERGGGTGEGIQELTNRHRQVGYAKAHIVHPILVYSEDIAVGIRRIVERRNQVLQRVSRLLFSTGCQYAVRSRFSSLLFDDQHMVDTYVVGELLEESLSLCFC